MAATHRLAGERTLRRKLDFDELGREAVHGSAAENAPSRVEEVAVGRFGLEQLRHLDHEPLEHGLDLELARHHLGCLHQRGLSAQPQPVLLEQLRRVER